MSGVICGIIYMDGRTVPEELASSMMNKICIYPMDVSRQWLDGQTFLGCGLQYITPESEREVLPFFDNSAQLAITADAIIDNRSELLDLLNIPHAEGNGISDSLLILMAYRKWGNESPKYLTGDFAFAIWDKKKREIFCARDQVGKRTFYYFHSESMFAFSTLMKPILYAINDRGELNEEWVTDYLALGGVLHEVDYDRTIFKNVKQLPPGHLMTINSSGTNKAQYWFPLKASELRLKNDYEYEEAFRDVFFEAVRCRLRTVGSVGVMLSGGLDSGAVASVAAREMENRGEELKAYSALPISEYEDWLPKRLIADESRYIDEYKKRFANIDITYCRSEGKSSITDIEKYLSVLEQPYKIIENLFWVDELEVNAAKNGCKVILDGQFGNLTISYGDFFTNILTLFRRYKWISVFREIQGYSRLHNINSLHAAKSMAGKIFIKDFIDRFYKKGNSYGDLNGLVPVNPELVEKWNTRERFIKAGFGLNSSEIHDLAEARKLITNNVLFSHLGPLDTKFSLANGLVRRDPTRDKRVVEFCMSLPGEQYVRNGHERNMVRRAMAGLLPDPVRTNIEHRGKQSADWIQRISPLWRNIRQDIEAMLEDKNMQTYLNITKLKDSLACLGDSIARETWGEEVRMLLISYIFHKFISSLDS